MTWHVLIGGEQKGPFEADTVVQMIRRGEVTAETLVWTAGIQDWTRAIDVPDFSDNFGGAAVAPSQPLRYGAEATDEDIQGISGRLNFGRVFSDAFKGLTARPSNTLIVVAVYAALSVLVSIPTHTVFTPKIILAMADPENIDMSVFNASDGGLYVLISLLSIALYGGLCAALTDLVRGDNPSAIRVLSGFPRIIPLFLFVIIFAILTAVGFILLVIPGFFVLASLMLGMFIIMDRRVGALRATKMCFRAARQLGLGRIIGLWFLTLAILIGVFIVYGLLAGVSVGIFAASSATADPTALTPSLTFNLIQTFLISLVMAVYLAFYAAAYKQAEPHLDAP